MIEKFTEFDSADVKFVKLETNESLVPILRYSDEVKDPIIYQFKLPKYLTCVVVKEEGKPDKLWFKWKFKGIEFTCLYIDDKPKVILGEVEKV